MITILLFLTTPFNSSDDEIAFFSDDVTRKSEQEMCEPLCSKDEESFIEGLSPASKMLYNSLDGRAKLRAIELSKKLQNKNEAVEIAALEMGKRQDGEYPFQKDYQDQIEEHSQLKPYTRRFGY